MAKQRIVNTNDPNETIRLAAEIGQRLRGGEALELISDLGGGKTTFVRGLARGIKSNDPVRSPSFTLGNEYHAPNITLYHFDFYRLDEPGIMRDELAEVVADSNAAVVVEWGGIAKDVLPEMRLKLEIKSTGLNSREIRMTYPDELEYLMKNT